VIVGSLSSPIYLVNLQQRFNHYFHLRKITHLYHCLSTASFVALNENAALRMQKVSLISNQNPRLKNQAATTQTTVPVQWSPHVTHKEDHRLLARQP